MFMGVLVQSIGPSARGPSTMSSEEPPTPASGFSWVAAPWGIQLRAAALGDFVHGWTCRQLQLRGPGEATGWRMMAEAAGVAPEDLVGLRQVHRTGVHRVVAARRPDTPPEADIVIADDRRAAVAVQVADCAPLLLGDGSDRACRGRARRVARNAGRRGGHRCSPVRGVGTRPGGPGGGHRPLDWSLLLPGRPRGAGGLCRALAGRGGSVVRLSGW